MFDIIETVNRWIKKNESVAVATVIKTWGSAPRREGSKLATTPDMAMVGSVSGGCVETAVIEEALETLRDGKLRNLHFGISDDTAWDVGLTCGGKISILVEQLNPTWWSIITEYVIQNKPLWIMTALETESEQKILWDGKTTLYKSDAITPEIEAAFINIAKTTQQSGKIKTEDVTIMVEVIAPKPKLILVGGVHVSMPLAKIAQQLGFRVFIIDPRSVFASEERFPNVESISNDYPDKALPQIGLDQHTYLAVLTHDPKIDDKALITALNHEIEIPYIGVLSSNRTHKQRTQRLMEEGITTAQIDRIRTPIGIDIGATNPEEIALCIMAEIIAVRNGVLT